MKKMRCRRCGGIMIKLTGFEYTDYICKKCKLHDRVYTEMPDKKV